MRRDLRDGAIPIIPSLDGFSRTIPRETRPDIRLGECVDETTVREGFHHIDSSTVYPGDKSEAGNVCGEILQGIGILFNRHIGREFLLDEYVIEEIRVVVEHGDSFPRKGFRRLMDDISPGCHREVPELLHSHKEAYPRFLYAWIVIVKHADIIAYEIPEGVVECECFRNYLYVALDEIDVGIVDIRVFERYIEDVGSPEDIGSGDHTIVQLFVLEDGDEISASHIEEEGPFIPMTPMCPSEQERLVEKTQVLQDHPMELRFIVVDAFLLFYDTYVIFSIFQVLQQEMVVFGGDDDDLGGAAVIAEPGDEELDEGLGDDCIADTIGPVEIEGLQLF